MIAAIWLSVGLLIRSSAHRAKDLTTFDLPAVAVGSTFDPDEANHYSVAKAEGKAQIQFSEDPHLNQLFSKTGPNSTSAPSDSDLSKTMVLLKNQDALLPLQPKQRKIAVVGIGASSLKKSLQTQHPDLQLSSWDLPTDGSGTADTVPTSAFPQGLTHESYSGKDFDGIPDTALKPELDESKVADSGVGYVTERWTGVFLPPLDGEYQIGLECSDSVRILLDGDVILERWNEGPRASALAKVSLLKDSFHVITFELSRRRTSKGPRAIWVLPGTSPYAQLTDALKESELILVRVDSLPDHSLPLAQAAMIDEIAKSRLPVVAVIDESTPLSSQSIKDQARAILAVWGSPANQGSTIAKVLFGSLEPGGRLPLTIWRDSSQWLNAPTYRDSYLRPLFPFGSGEGYSSFSFRDPYVPPVYDPAGLTPCHVSMQNNGSRDGDDVIQVYARFKNRRADDSRLVLVGSRRVRLRKGVADRYQVDLDMSQVGRARSNGSTWSAIEPVEVFVGDHQPSENRIDKFQIITIPRKSLRLKSATILAR